MIYVNEQMFLTRVEPPRLDLLLASGWRHFGTFFFRYSLIPAQGRIREVIPLRIRLDRFTPSRSQRRILRRNQDLSVVIRPSLIDDTREDLFDRHKQRFTDNVPDSLHDFLSDQPATIPCTNHEICAFLDDRLVAVSFLDLGRSSASAVCAIFEPDLSARSLGIFLILRGIEYAKSLDLKYYYPGYAYRGASHYDYKKGFSGLEMLDWSHGWRDYSGD